MSIQQSSLSNVSTSDDYPAGTRPTHRSLSRAHRFVIAHPIGVYLMSTFTIAWILFVPALLGTSGAGVLAVNIPVLPLVLLASILGVALPGYVVTRLVDGTSGTRELRRQILHGRVDIRWYLFALCGIPVAAILSASLWLAGMPLRELVRHGALVYTSFLPNVLVIGLLISIWEEMGWTGFLLPRLQARYGPLKASILVAVPWGMIHLPLILVVGGVSDSHIPVSMYPVWFLYLVIFPAPFRFVTTWLYNRTAGSLIIVALFHATFDTMSGKDILPVLTGGGDTLWLYGVLAALASIIVISTHGRLGFQNRPSGESK